MKDRNPTRTSARADNWRRIQAKMDRTMLGLAVSALSLKPGQTRSQKELARFCECSPQAIADIEHRAVTRIRRALRLRHGIISTSL